MLTRSAAMQKANAYLRELGLPDVAVAATPNPEQRLWIVQHRNAAQPEVEITGGSPPVVPEEGAPYWASGSIPPWPEEIGMDEPESWKLDRGEGLLPSGWSHHLRSELDNSYWRQLIDFVGDDRLVHDVFPPPSQTFAAFELTDYDDVQVVILGQDPYPTPGHAHGLAFSVPAGVAKPKSLVNIHAVLESDLARPAPAHGNLEGWARQGVLLLNTVLTIRAGSDDDHAAHRRWQWERQGWQTFTDAVIRVVNSKAEPVVFILWGRPARRKRKLITNSRHLVVESSHPSPLSAYRGFLDSRPFSQTNQFLQEAGRRPIDWTA